MATEITPDQLEEALKLEFVAMLRGVATEVSTRMITKAPSKTGALKASIKAGINQEVVEFSATSTDPSGSATISENAATIKKANAGDVINIIVGAPYGEDIEKGSSAKAPQGFILTTGEEMDAIVTKVKSEIGKYK